MKLLRLHLKAFGPFTDRVLDFCPAGQPLALVHGPNEAGKSSTLRAISDLRYGIDHVSTDAFVHDYREMRVGGVFLAPDGRRYGVMRRKGRQATRTLTAFDPDAGPDAGDEDRPAEAAVERLLGAGLSKDEHAAMFALDHQRLRDGGRALLEGRGELGAALFEASAGVRSIPALLTQFDQAAKRWYVPRGSKGRINEALRDYEQQHKALREATVTPLQWAGLRRRHEEAAAALARFEEAKAARLAELMLVRELRAVAPLLGTIGQARQTLAALAGAPLLAPGAPAARVAAETALAEARHAAQRAATEAAHEQARLDGLRCEPGVIEAAAAIERLAAAAEQLDALNADLARAAAEADAARMAIDACAARIDGAAAAGDVLARVPAPAARAALEEGLARVDKAAQALEHHLATLPPPADGGADAEEGVSAAVPSPESRTALGAAVREATRIDAVLVRLDALPAEIARAGREAQAALGAVGAHDAAALDRMRPLPDTEIDAALRSHDAREARDADLRRRLREMAGTRDALAAERDELLAAGAVATRDDVLAARSRRDAAWRRWRALVALGAEGVGVGLEGARSGGGVGTGAGTGAGTGTHSGDGAGAGTGMGTGTRTGAGAATGTGTGTRTETGAGTGTGARTGVGAGAGIGLDTDSGTGAGPEEGAGADLGAGVDVVAAFRAGAGRPFDARDAAGAVAPAAAVAGADADAGMGAALVSPAVGSAFADAFELALAVADRLADDLARDGARAARLQASLRAIDALDADIARRERELAAVADEARDDADRWSARLADAGLPAMAPRVLREWQAWLAAARRAVEALDRLRDEHAQAAAACDAAARSLRAALRATGLAAPADDAPLRTLSAVAAQVGETIRQHEKRNDTAAGQRDERERARRGWLEREAELRRRLDAARDAARPALLALGLPADAAPAVARARLAEFERLRSAHDALGDARSRLERSRGLLAALQRQSADLAARLGEPAPGDVRHHADRLLARLAEARRIDGERRLAEQAARSAADAVRRHGASAAHQQALLAALCEAAGVAAPAGLPEAEECSRRRREAQAALDAALAQLASASRRPHDELHALLAQRDPARLAADEDACEHALAGADAPLREAREAEQAARRELEAIDGGDSAAAARERMEQAAAGVRDAVGPWMRSRLAHALLAEATRRFRERAQGPMLTSASAYFGRMTGGEFVRLLSDDAEATRPVLLAERRDGRQLHVEALSEGTCDQLYLALRLAALDMRRAAGVDLPVVLDDVLMTSDDHRAALMLQALADFARGGQVIVFTHHGHLAEVARASVPAEALWTVGL